MLLRLAYLGMTNAFAILCLLPMSDRDKDIENLALRHQITVLERQLGQERVRFTPADRAFLAAILHQLPRNLLRRLRLLVRPDTVLRWHRNLIARHHTTASSQNAQTDHAPPAPSQPWYCAWQRRTPAGMPRIHIGPPDARRSAVPRY
ncbi:hypothetical protein [Saccharopolyspora sp. NPDC002376]